MISERPIVQTVRLTKRWGPRTTVDNVELTVARGDIFGFLGPNGAGKSTTLRMLLGLVRPSAGRALLFGEDVHRRRRVLARVGAIVEAPAFWDHLPARKNLEILAALSGGAAPKRIDAVLEWVGLAGRAREPVSQFSHGMRQRLGLAQALLPQPELVVLDEPTDGLDPQGIHEMRALVRRLRDELGLTVLLSSHLLGEVEQLCNRVAILSAGRLVHQGETGELVGASRALRIVVDERDRARALELLSREPGLDARERAGAIEVSAPPEEAARLNAELVRAGISVRELGPVRASLEDVFLRLTRPVGAAVGA